MCLEFEDKHLLCLLKILLPRPQFSPLESERPGKKTGALFYRHRTGTLRGGEAEPGVPKLTLSSAALKPVCVTWGYGLPIVGFSACARNVHF